MRVMLFGGTDLTLEAAKRIRACGLELAGVIHVGACFRISYRRDGVNSARFADVRRWCVDHAIAQQRWDNADAASRFAADSGAEFALAAGWYHMIPAALRAQFPSGCAGIHASLLPSLRGGAPLNWALLNGDAETGVTLFELGDGVDDGPIYGQQRIAIAQRATIGELVEAARWATADLISRCLPQIASGVLNASPQQGEPSYGLQRMPEDGRINWDHSAVNIDRLVRAVGHPYPGAFTHLRGKLVKLWDVAPLPQMPPVYGAPGQLFRLPGVASACVLTGNGALALLEATWDDEQDASLELRRSSHQRFGT